MRTSNAYEFRDPGAPMLAAKKARADAFAAKVEPVIKEVRAAGAATLQSIADALNARGIATATGKGRWEPTSVRNLLKRLPAI